MNVYLKHSVFGLLLLPVLACAEGPRAIEPQDLLNQLAVAAQQLSYSGIFVFQHDGRMEASRVIHAFENGQEHTKIDTLDGPPREIIRANDEMRCYFPDARSVRLEHGQGRRFFPALIAPPFQTYLDNYDIAIVGSDRVAGHDCQVIKVSPRDNLRFAHQFCADLLTNLLLKEVTLGPHGEPVQMSVFTEVTIGAHPDLSQFKPAYSDTASWRLDTNPSVGPEVSGSGWVVSSVPPGFRKIVEVRRAIPGRNGTMTHMLYSDGLASISVFIEPADGPPRPNRIESLRSSLSYFSARTAENQITVVGEVPLASVTQMGQSVINLRSSHP
ncbi:MAG: MucB/RseB C-terminal domain-containing protein [Betaproteobacteria bacterium]|nr:MucB/RseB C-terminal domain-containing protein [Betaproteobacteria bacterium]